MFLAYPCLHAVLLAIITTVIAEQKCDPVGKEGNESPKELALLKRLEQLKGLSFNITDNVGENEQYVYTFRMCQEVFSNMSNSGLVQFNKQMNKWTVVGRINETHIVGGSKWIILTYKGGDSYNNHCGNEKRKAIIMITCNRNTLSSGFTIVTEEREKEEDCSYVFEFESKLACPLEESHLSIGSILLITFASLVAVYIIGGFLYQRLVVGAKGMEQFPHLVFWQDLGNLVADGCDFLCRSRPQNVPAAYRGVGDDQLGEESEERDDHLLPM
ncbi:cation-dependent mannose-6-phosphate receptor isoform X2 [Hemicordylus capensis]|nr:cation-dependent mannose-6-phosphate receptor isoform X2 [Hemicordylus capensis]